MAVTHKAPPAWRGRTDPEEGAGARRVHQLAGADGARAVLGFACDAGVRRNHGRPGAADGPDALRDALRQLAVPDAAEAFHDAGNVCVDGDALEAGQALLATHVATLLAHHERVVVFGGGHETAFGTWSGLRQSVPDARIGIVNIDAHLDLRVPGPAGGSSGTPFHQIRTAAPERFDYLCLGAAAESNTSALFERARQWGATVVADTALQDDAAAGDAAIAALVARCDRIQLSVCLDALPQSVAPGVSAPAGRGMALGVVEHLVESVLEAANTAAVPVPITEIVELAPRYDRDGATARVAALLAYRVLFH